MTAILPEGQIMKRTVSALISLIFLLCCLPFVISGCSAGSNVKTDENGLMYFKAEDYINTYVSSYLEKAKKGPNKKNAEKNAKAQEGYLSGILKDVEGYVCAVSTVSSPDLVIPDEFNGVPVVALTSYEYELKAISSIKIGSNVKYIFDFRNFGHNTKLKEITIPKNVIYCAKSFSNLEDATVYLEGKPEMIGTSFSYSKSIRIVVNDNAAFKSIAAEKYTSYTANKVPIVYADCNNDDIVGTKKLFEYSDSFDGDKVLKAGTGHFQEKLDASKQIEPGQAKQIAKFLDGPVVSMKDCPPVSEEDYYYYNKEQLNAKAGQVYYNVAQVADSFPESYYEPQGKRKVYFIVEKTGSVRANYSGADIYFMVYRVSVRDYETDNLLCWFRLSPGVAPQILNVDQGTFKDGERRYLYDEGKKIDSPVKVVYEYFK